MKKTNIKMMLMLVCMTLGLTGIAKAQIYSNDACFYAKDGESKVGLIVRFEGDQCCLISGQTQREIKDHLAKSFYFYENANNTKKYVHRIYEYDANRSTPVREVYKFDKSGYAQIYYIAFSKDMTSCITWMEDKRNYDGTIKRRIDYTQIPKTDLLPKAVNDDFLY